LSWIRGLTEDKWRCRAYVVLDANQLSVEATVVAPAEGAVGTADAGPGICELTTKLTTDLKSCAPSHRVSILDIPRHVRLVDSIRQPSRRCTEMQTCGH
jgi:hypothetical protein